MGILIFLFFWWGASVGSFINMLVWRIKFGTQRLGFRSVLGRSFCDSCRRQLAWWENIPIISFLILRGRCHTCHSPIPYWYPLIEAGAGLSFVLTYLTGQAGLDGRIGWWGFLIVAVLIFVLLSDALTFVIPDSAVFLLLILAVLARLRWIDWTAFFSGAAAALFLFLLHLLTKGEGMGLGDVKFAFFMGFFLGFPKIVLAFYLSFVLGGVFGIFLLAFKKARLGEKIPFGPFLVLGVLISFWWGDWILREVAFFLGAG